MSAGMRVGALVVDTRLNRIGYVMDHVGPCVQLRPPGGGREWDAKADAVRPATDAERQCSRALSNAERSA
ncbi:hypothetical protein [Streptomyces sp. NPDC005244]|uniref:hypothetical protein n=1 Tax=Streptomyces sp. NPDC005244 TaxID=3364708 RepID=UPI0036C4499A